MARGNLHKVLVVDTGSAAIFGGAGGAVVVKVSAESAVARGIIYKVFVTDAGSTGVLCSASGTVGVKVSAEGALPVVRVESIVNTDCALVSGLTSLAVRIEVCAGQAFCSF